MTAALDSQIRQEFNDDLSLAPWLRSVVGPRKKFENGQIGWRKRSMMSKEGSREEGATPTLRKIDERKRRLVSKIVAHLLGWPQHFCAPCELASLVGLLFFVLCVSVWPSSVRARVRGELFARVCARPARDSPRPSFPKANFASNNTTASFTS